MFHMPRTLIPQQPLLPLHQHLLQQFRHIRFLPQILQGREQSFEVEDDGAGEGEAAEGLPVDAEVDAGEGEEVGGELRGVEGEVGVGRGGEEGTVDFEGPGAALDGAGGGEAGEVAVGWEGGGVGVSCGGVAVMMWGMRGREREEGGWANRRVTKRKGVEGRRTGPWKIPSSLYNPAQAHEYPSTACLTSYPRSSPDYYTADPP